MEKLIINLLENFHIIMLIIMFLCFIIPMIHILAKRKKRKVKKDILNKKTIMVDSGIYYNIGLNLFLLIFFTIGLTLIYLAIKYAENNFTMIFGIIFGIAMCLIPIIISLKTIKTAIIVRNNEYVIILDELMDKYYYNDRAFSGENVDRSGWRLYFKDFFKAYDKYIFFRDLKEGNEYKIGDKFYLVFIKGTSIPYIFHANEYTLAQSEKDKLKTINEAKDYIKLEEFNLEKENHNKKIIVNKETIIGDFFDKKQKQTVLFNILAMLVIAPVMIASYTFYFNWAGLIITSLMFIFALLNAILHIKHLLTVINNIKKGNFIIKEDEVVSLNNNLQFSDSNKMISFKFKNYKKIVYADKKDYLDSKIADKFYLVFIKGEKEPIKVYDVNNIILDKGNIEK